MIPIHGLRAGQWGSVVVSTPLFARYEIGDLIEAFGKGYFRVFGRNTSVLTVMEHRLFKTLTLRF